MKNTLLILLAILFIHPSFVDAKSVKLGNKGDDHVSRGVDASRGTFSRETTGNSVVCKSHTDCAADQKCEGNYCQNLCRLGTDATESLNGDPSPHCPDYPETPMCYVDTSSRSSYCGCEEGSCAAGSKCSTVANRKKCVYCSKKTSGDSSTNSSVDTCGCPAGKYPNGTGQCVSCPNDYYCGASERCYSPGTIASKCVPLKCESGSIVDHNCQDCDVTNCIKCSQNTATCEACKDGYHLTSDNRCVQCAIDEYWSDADKACVHVEGCLEANQDDNDGTCLKCDYVCSTNDCTKHSLASTYKSYFGPGGGKGFGYGKIPDTEDRSGKKHLDAGYCSICFTKKNDDMDSYYYLTMSGECKLCNNGDPENKCRTCGYSGETNLFICGSCSTKESAAVAFNGDQTKCEMLGCDPTQTFYRTDTSYESTISDLDPKLPGKGRTAAQLQTASCVPTCATLAEDPKVQDSADCSAYNGSSNYFYAIRQTDNVFKKSVNGYADFTCYRCEPISISRCTAAIEDGTGEVCTTCVKGYMPYSNGKKCGNICTFTTCNEGFGKSNPLKTNVQDDTCACN